MLRFTIGDIETLTGIKTSTLRLWEQRYKLIAPRRKASLHRYYDSKDLKKLLHFSSLYKTGYAVAKMATLTHQQMVDLIKKTRAGEAHYPVFINQLTEAALDFSEQEFMASLNLLIEKLGFKECITDVCYPYLVQLSQLSTNNLMPALKRFSAHLIQNRIIAETGKLLVTPSVQPEILLMNPQRETNELPLCFIYYLLKKNGWGTVYLGTNVKPEDIEPVLQLPGPHHLFFHLAASTEGPDADDFFERVCKKFKNKKIIASGEGIQQMQRNFTNLTILKTDQQIYDFIEGNKPGVRSR